MFCHNCGAKPLDEARYCTDCGTALKRETSEAGPSGLVDLTKSDTTSTFGRVKSFLNFKRAKGTQWKESVSKKGKGKAQEQKASSKDVIIYIGIAEWHPKTDTLRKKHGKRLALKVNTLDPPAALLEKALTKWKAYHSNHYEEDGDYVLLLEDFQEAVYIPGSTHELFQIGRYQEEIGKDFKRITLYICTKSDFDSHVNRDQAIEDLDKEEKSDDSDDDRMLDTPTFITKSNGSIEESSSSEQVTKDHELALSLHASFIDDSDLDGDLQESISITKPCDPASVVRELQDKVVQTEQMFLTTRRGIPLSRIVQLWQRERKRKSVNSRVIVKYLGEAGIDTGALSREFFTDAIKEIGQTMFPNGSPVHSTLFIKNGTFRTVGEIIAASVAHNGPSPCCMEEVVYNTLVNPNVDLRSLDPTLHLTSSERDQIAKIRSNFKDCHDIIMDHGYTGPLKEENIEDIIGSVVVSIVSRRLLALGEFMEGLQAYDFKKHLMNNPKVCQVLFVKGQAEEVNANYLVSLLHPEFSEKDKPHRAAEDQVLDNFQDFIYSLEDEKMQGYASAVAWNYDDGEGENEENNGEERYESANLTPAGLMQWLTGQGHRNLTQNDIKITVKFDHYCKLDNPLHTVCYPYVGACGMEITFPVLHMTNDEEFKQVFLTAFCKGQAFGRS